MNTTNDAGTIDATGKDLFVLYTSVVGGSTYTTKFTCDAGTVVYDFQSNNLLGTFAVQDANHNTIVTLSQGSPYREKILADHTVRYLKATQGSKYYIAGDQHGTRVHVAASAVNDGVTIAVSSVALTPAAVSVFLDATTKLTPTFTPLAPSNLNLTWESSDPTVATVDGSGTVSPLAPGVTTVKVTTADGGKTATSQVSVQVAGALYAGTGSNGTTNGSLLSAKFWKPLGIASNGTVLYVADSNSTTIRKLDPGTGQVTTLVDLGADRYPEAQVMLKGLLYVTTYYGEILSVDPTAETPTATVVAGTLSKTNVDSTDGSGTSAKFYRPFGITTDGIDLYVSDQAAHLVRKVTTGGVVTTLAGSTEGNSDNTTGTSARFRWPWGMAYDGVDTLYVVDSNGIRTVGISGNHSVGTLAVTGATITSPTGVAYYNGALYITDNEGITKVTLADGKAFTYASTPLAAGYLVKLGSQFYLTHQANNQVYSLPIR